MNQYIKIKNIIYGCEVIKSVDCKEIENLTIKVTLFSGDEIIVEGLDAIEVVMQVKPSIVEGKRFKFRKGAWIVHNLLAHPIMQMLSLIGCYKLALWIHEITVPRPRGKYGD